MAQIFAGIDEKDNVRFVGDVQKGAACGLRCVSCKAPLIAKQGEINAWHLAHEAGQERPQCYVGAVNLLRRLALGWLSLMDTWDVPQPSAKVTSRVSGKVHVANWVLSDLQPTKWYPDAAKDSPMASLACSWPVEVQLFVTIDKAPELFDGDPEQSWLNYHCPMPDQQTLQNEDQTRKFIEQTGRFQWLRMADFDGQLAKIRQAVQAEQLQHDKLLRDERSRAAGRRWAQIAGAGRNHAAPPERTQPQTTQTVSEPISQPEQDDGLPQLWRGLQKPGHGYTYYGLNDGNDWLALTLRDGTQALVPWPVAEEGWEESLPPSVAVYDEVRQIMRATQWANTIVFLNARAHWVLSLDYPLSEEELKRLKRQREH